MSRQEFIEKVKRERYVCDSCNLPLPESISDPEWFAIMSGGNRLDFHKKCLWNHLVETWIPYKN